MEEYVTFFLKKEKRRRKNWHEREKIGIMYGNVSWFRAFAKGFFLSVTVIVMLRYFF